MQKKFSLAIVVLFALIGGLTGVAAVKYTPLRDSLLSFPSLNTDYTEANSSYQFINPLLFCKDSNVDNSLSDSVSRNISSEVKKYVDDAQAAGTITEAAVYFRDLNNGPWAYVNPGVRSIP